MTNNTREKLRAVLLTALMIGSVSAAGIAFTGGAAADTSGDISVTIGGDDFANVSAGSGNNSLGLIMVTDNANGGALSTETTVSLPDGLSINEAQTDLVVDTNQSDGLGIADVSTSGDTIIITHEDGTVSNANEAIRIKGLVVNAAADADASHDGTIRNLTVDHFTAETPESVSGFNISKPELADDGGPFTAAAASSGTNTPFYVNTSLNGQIGNNTEIVLSVPSDSGVTFNTSVDPDTLTDGTNVNDSEATISENEITIPVTSNFSAGDSLYVDGLEVNTSASASDTNLTATVTPVEATGDVTAESNQPADGAIQIQKPTISAGFSTEAAVGNSSQGPFGEVNITSASADSIGQNTNVTLQLNNSDVTFDTSTTATATVYPDGGAGSPTTVDPVVNENNITVNVSTDVNADSTGDVVGFSGFAVNVSDAAVDDAEVGFLADTQSQEGGVTVTTDVTATALTLQKPVVDFDGETVNVDNDGESGDSISDINVTDVTDNNLGIGENITVSLNPEAGVSFDQSAVVGANGAGGDTPVVNEYNVTVNVTQDVGVDGSVNFTGLAVNTTADAVNVTPTVTTNTGDSEIVVDAPNQITINNVDPITVNNNTAAVGSGTVIVGETVTGGVQIQDSNTDAFGGANVNLEIVEAPDGASTQSLNATAITTAGDGTAEFNLTAGEVTGDYVVNATTSHGSQNITFTAEPGAVDGVTVTPIEDAITDTNGNLGNASLYVNATDQYGNPVSETASVDLTADNVGSDLITVYDDWNGDDGENNPQSVSDGSFDIDSSDGSSVVVIDNTQVEDVTIDAAVNGESDSGTVTFFDEVGQVDVTLNESTVFPGADVMANATVSQADGTTITVPDVQITVKESTTNNVSLDSTTVGTNGDGLASTTFTADASGDATIKASSNLKSASTTLTVEERPNVTLSNINLDPSTVGANSSNNHTLSFDAAHVSDDGNTDTFTVTIPDAATLESANSVSVTDADGNDVALDGGPDVSNNTITFSVAPDSSADYRRLTVDANVTVAAPDVSEETMADITIDAADSSNGQDSANATLTVEPLAQPNLSVDYTVDSTTVSVNETVTATATVENTGTASGSTTVTFYADGTEVANESVDVDAGNSTTVEFTTSFAEAGTHNVTVNDRTATDITVEEDTGPGPVIGEDAPTDPDGDGQYEDVNGDGTADVLDVQALFANQDSNAVQNNTAAFDYNEDGSVDVVDVQALFAQL